MGRLAAMPAASWRSGTRALTGALAVILVATGLPGCSAPSLLNGPDASYFEKLNERVTRSVSGPWQGLSPTVSIKFSLLENAAGQVTGTGTMLETPTSNPVAITLSGTYSKPSLMLTIDGMVYQGQVVRGTFQGQYTSFVGITSKLTMVASGGTTAIDFFLQEEDNT